MNEAPIEGQTISRMWAFSAMLICMAIAIALNETVVHGHAKAIFFALFMTAFITKMTQTVIRQAKIRLFLVGVLIFHAFLAFAFPNDASYPGGLLFPVGILDLIVMYFIFQKVARAV